MKTRNTCTAAIMLAGMAVFGMAGVGASQENIISDSHTYTLATCPVTGQPLGSMGDPVIETINGREVRFCCAGCVGTYRGNIAEYEAKVNAAIIEQQKDVYPLDRCVVMDTELGSMGDPVDYVYQNRLVRFCCAGCKGMFESEPDKYLKKLDAAALERRGDLKATDACIVDGEPLGDAPVLLVIANRVLPLHTEACADVVRANPAQYLDKGNAPKNPPAGEHQHAPAAGNPGQSGVHDAHTGHQHTSDAGHSDHSCPAGASAHSGVKSTPTQQRTSSCCG